MTTIHPFEAANLGKSPFICTAVSDNAIPDGAGGMLPQGTCDYCGNGIRYEYHIRSSDGRCFKVGCDCVAKCDADLEWKSRSMAAVAKMTQEQLAAKSAQEQRQAEFAKKASEAREADKNTRALTASQWAWLAEVLRPLASDLAKHDYIDGRGEVWIANSFIGGVVADLLNGSASFVEMSERRQSIALEIYAKKFGRRNSKAYNSEIDEITAKIDSMCETTAA